MLIENLPKGALPDKNDPRDYQIMGAPTVDWSDFELPEPPDADQGSSDSCVAQAWSYYFWQLTRKDYSRRDLFCRIALGYGAVIRDGGLEIVNRGIATRSEVPDPNPQTPQNMRDKTGTKQEYRDDDKALNSFVVPKDIDSVAWAIKEYKGVVFGVWGNNATWGDLENPQPPNPNWDNWGHALYPFGSHMHNGLKCIIAKSSWCSTGIKRHHIKENYFAAGMTFNPWTLIPKEQQFMSNTQFVHKAGTEEYGFYIPATSEESIKDKALNYGVDIQKPDGTVDFSRAKEVQGL